MQRNEKNPQPKPSLELRIPPSKRKLITCANPGSETGFLGVGLQLGALGIGIHYLVHEVIAQNVKIQCVAFVQSNIRSQ